MIRVTKADKVRQEVAAPDGQKKPMYVLILLDEACQRYMRTGTLNAKLRITAFRVKGLLVSQTG
jgi:hypothetical protein